MIPAWDWDLLALLSTNEDSRPAWEFIAQLRKYFQVYVLNFKVPIFL